MYHLIKFTEAVMERLLCLLIGYLLGSFLTAEIVSRIAAHKSSELWNRKSRNGEHRALPWH